MLNKDIKTWPPVHLLISDANTYYIHIPTVSWWLYPTPPPLPIRLLKQTSEDLTAAMCCSSPRFLVLAFPSHFSPLCLFPGCPFPFHSLAIVSIGTAAKRIPARPDERTHLFILDYKHRASTDSNRPNCLVCSGSSGEQNMVYSSLSEWQCDATWTSAAPSSSVSQKYGSWSLINSP